MSIGTGIAIFGAAFGMWAWVVAWGVSVMRKEISELKTQMLDIGTSHHTHINQTERRLTMLEAEFGFVKNAMHLARPHHEPQK